MSETIDLLQEGRLRELEQALFYRFLTSDAELAGDAAAAERLNELLADEQHHVSRLTARILELGAKPRDAGVHNAAVPVLHAWEAEARKREEGEVRWYENTIRRVDDPDTASMLRGILDSERHHREQLAGKWMPAGPARPEEST